MVPTIKLGNRDFPTFSKHEPGTNDFGKIIHLYQSNWENGYKTEQGILCKFDVNLRIFLRKKYFEGMIYISTTNVQGYFGIFYLKIGKFYTFFQLGKGPIMGPKISLGKSLGNKVLLMLQLTAGGV